MISNIMRSHDLSMKFQMLAASARRLDPAWARVARGRPLSEIEGALVCRAEQRSLAAVGGFPAGYTGTLLYYHPKEIPSKHRRAKK